MVLLFFFPRLSFVLLSSLHQVHDNEYNGETSSHLNVRLGEHWNIWCLILPNHSHKKIFYTVKLSQSTQLRIWWILTAKANYLSDPLVNGRVGKIYNMLANRIKCLKPTICNWYQATEERGRVSSEKQIDMSGEAMKSSIADHVRRETRSYKPLWNNGQGRTLEF